MTNPDLEQLVEIIKKNSFVKIYIDDHQRDEALKINRDVLAQAILDAGYVKAEKILDIEQVNGEYYFPARFSGKHIQVFVREIKE